MITFDAAGPVWAMRELRRRLGEVETVGRALKTSADLIWVPRIASRFGESRAASGYREELSHTMSELDPDFVRRLSGSENAAWAQRTELERRGEYARMGVTEEIIAAIDAAGPFKAGGLILVTIGDVGKLNQLTRLGDTGYYLWQLLEYGTGVYGSRGSAVIREKRQIFYGRDGSKGGVLTQSTENLTQVTENPGFRGRHAFLDVDGDFYESDRVGMGFLVKYISFWVRRLSYKRKGGE